jgi:co-chaperonin GroES (HSP10)
LNPIEINKIRALNGKVLVHNIEQGEKRTKNGIIMTDDDGKERGIRERWAQVYAVGQDIDDISVGQWILIKHGRWSRGIDIKSDDTQTTIRQVDYPEAVLLVADECPIET